MNREERIRRELPAGHEDVAGILAAHSAGEVDRIVAALRASRREGREHEKEMRARARRSRRHDADDLAIVSGRMLAGIGRRGASGDLDAAAALYSLVMRQGSELLDLTVDGLRARGYRDTEIGAGFGITRQAVGQRFGRKGAFTGTEGAA